MIGTTLIQKMKPEKPTMRKNAPVWAKNPKRFLDIDHLAYSFQLHVAPETMTRFCCHHISNAGIGMPNSKFHTETICRGEVKGNADYWIERTVWILSCAPNIPKNISI